MKKLLLASLLLCSVTCQAYIDPGTGSFIFQFLAAGLLTGIFTLKTYWSTIKNFFIKKK